MITLGILSWNQREIVEDTLLAAQREAWHLERSGEDTQIVVVDNGSEDGSATSLMTMSRDKDLVIPNFTNVGNSIARNQILDEADRKEAEFVLFLDGDVHPISGSLMAMLEHMRMQPDCVYCVGFFSMNQTPNADLATKQVNSLKGSILVDHWDVAWTQYGLFRRSAIVAAEARFCEQYGPGWGWEDNDLHQHMHERGFHAHCFMDAVYLHRNHHSSWPLLKRAGIDPRSEYYRRKNLFLSRWGHRETPMMAAYRAAQFPDS